VFILVYIFLTQHVINLVVKMLNHSTENTHLAGHHKTKFFSANVEVYFEGI
jgi:hypothetical protein